MIKAYNEKNYPKYDNYDVVNIDRVAEIPYDYDGIMGVPISFSSCPAYGIVSNYINGSTIKQDYLQTALSWIAERDKISIEDYMAFHQHDKTLTNYGCIFKMSLTG